jgi:hypothetical protein
MSIAPESTSEAELSLQSRYEAVRSRIASAALRCGRRPEDVLLVVVTKFASIDQIRQLLELGHEDLAENRVQALAQRVAQIGEFLERRRQLAGARAGRLPEPRWHMIGHLQRNKVRKVIPLVRLIHSLDSLRLAEEIQVAAAKREEPVQVLVQVNTSGEKTRQGVAPPAALHLVEQIDTMLHLKPRGLMCMAPLVDDPARIRPVFERCRELFDDIRAAGAGGHQFDILSMGMSSDFEFAIECGANMVRVGSAIFGSAPPDLIEEPEEEQ